MATSSRELMVEGVGGVRVRLEVMVQAAAAVEGGPVVPTPPMVMLDLVVVRPVVVAQLMVEQVVEQHLLWGQPVMTVVLPSKGVLPEAPEAA